MYAVLGKAQHIIFALTAPSLVCPTTQSPIARFPQHQREIERHQAARTTWGSTRLYRHFCKAGHLPHHLKVESVEEIHEGMARLKTRESHWTKALMTNEPHGLNRLQSITAGGRTSSLFPLGFRGCVLGSVAIMIVDTPLL